MPDALQSQAATLSLIIPAYNRADLICETIESALKQTRPFAEIIVVNDGSTDHTLDVLQKYIDRIQIIQTPNQGVQAARNEGVAAANSKYITLCDSDDLLDPRFVEILQSCLETSPDCDILYCNFIPFDEHSNYPDKFSLAPDWFFDGAESNGNLITEIPDLYVRLMTYQPLFPTGSTMKKAFYQEIGGYDSKFKSVGSEDLEFLLRAVSLGRLGVLLQPLGRVRKHAGNDSRNSMRQSVGEALIFEYALKNHPRASVYQDIILQSIEKRRIGAFNDAYAQGEFTTASEIFSLLREIPRDLRVLLKRMIMALPSLLKETAWRVTQK
ncbi:glycosyltransferase family 2 protein [Noviherbaspirillum sedimenti]|uniref:Glycosyltransferase family 2 protein n=1 Tax=Noviherbaspirillum sedimenti TaxID=2320865 RepID=A0A3A3G543_9BURK|nr:glycosyltransferase family 2 protein [Noviherbaspirillum sedimenti]RJG01899.1 glycosyltransferase family 2 protein [Noviherbaspirillum sedimenti]